MLRGAFAATYRNSSETDQYYSIWNVAGAVFWGWLEALHAGCQADGESRSRRLPGESEGTVISAS
jgi:hypothetical protein